MPLVGPSSNVVTHYHSKMFALMKLHCFTLSRVVLEGFTPRQRGLCRYLAALCFGVPEKVGVSHFTPLRFGDPEMVGLCGRFAAPCFGLHR